MKFGMMFPTMGALATGPNVMETQLSIAQQAEALGFESVWVPDHVVIPTSIKSRYPYNATGDFPMPADQGFLEPLAALGFLAGVTRRVRLGTWVLVLPHRNPIVTAKMWATLDVLSGGRMMVGVGIGWMEEEIQLLGAPFNKRGALSDEYLQAMKELWTKADPQFEGKFVQFSGIKCEPKPVQKPLPVWIGGHSARAMRRVVELGDGWVAVPKTYAAFEESFAGLKAAAERAGRDLKSIQMMIGPAYCPTLEAYFEEIKKYQDLGYDYFLAPVAFWAQGVQGTLKMMEEFAHRAKM